jgi:hypothetical protein
MWAARSKAEKRYLHESRLADVIAMIQVLALDPHTHRTEEGLTKDLSGKPRSGKSWIAVGEEHPEFFRVRKAETEHVSLVARHVIPENDDRVRELPEHFPGQLIEAAINLHDRQVRRDERWVYLVPIWVALLAGLFTLVVTYTKLLLRIN